MPNRTHGVTRRNLGRMAVAGTALAALPAGVARAQAKELRVLAFEGYAEKEWVDAFERATGAKAVVTLAGTVDEIFAKIQATQGRDYDVVSIDTSLFKRYTTNKLLQPVDYGAIPNAANLLPAFRDLPPLTVGGKKYGVPLAWGGLVLIYDKAAFPTPPDSWNVMWDSRLAQKLISQDDANNNIVLAAIVLGIKDPFNLTDDDFARVKAKLIEQKKLLLTYYGGMDEGAATFANSGVAAMFSMGESQTVALKKKNVDAVSIVPKEGAIGWIDCWAVSVGCRDLPLAYAWINASIAQPSAAIISGRVGYGNTTDQAANDALHLTYSDRLIYLQAPEDFEKRVKIWNEVKAAG